MTRVRGKVRVWEVCMIAAPHPLLPSPGLTRDPSQNEILSSEMGPRIKSEGGMLLPQLQQTIPDLIRDPGAIRQSRPVSPWIPSFDEMTEVYVQIGSELTRCDLISLPAQLMTRAVHPATAKGKHIIVNCGHLKAGITQLPVHIDIVAH